MKKLFLLPSSKDCNFEKGIFGVDWFRERRKTISPKFSTSLMESLIAISVTRLGYFWRFIVTNFLKNTTKIYGNYLIKPHFWSENCYGYFLGQLWKNFAYFYSNIWPHCNLQLMLQTARKPLLPHCGCSLDSSKGSNWGHLNRGWFLRPLSRSKWANVNAFRGFKLTGPTVIMIYRMMAADLLRFVAIYFIFVMGFAQGESAEWETRVLFPVHSAAAQ